MKDVSIQITQSKTGFSLIELVIVIALMGFLAALGIPRLSKFAADSALEQEALNFKSRLEEMRSKAQSSARNATAETEARCWGIGLVDGMNYRTGYGTYVPATRSCSDLTGISNFNLSSQGVYLSFSISNEIVFRPGDGFVGDLEEETDIQTARFTKGSGVVSVTVRQNGNVEIQ